MYALTHAKKGSGDLDPQAAVVQLFPLYWKEEEDFKDSESCKI